MYPNLYYLVKDLFHLDLPALKVVQSFGFFVAIAFLLCAYFFAKELKRKSKEGLLASRTVQVKRGGKATPGELITSAIIGFVVFYKLIYIISSASELDNTQDAIKSLQGNFIAGVLGAAGFAFFKYYEKESERKKYKLDEPKVVNEVLRPQDHVGNMTVLAAIGGLIGAKLFAVFEDWDGFMQDPAGTLFSFSGLTMYGGLIVGAAAVLLYARKNNLTLTHVMDACAPALFLAYGVGRIGCHVAGDGDWGVPNLHPAPHFLPQWMWSYNYPHNVIHDGVPIRGCEGSFCSQLDPPVWPTPLYEAVVSILLFAFLWSIRKKLTTPGVLFSLYLVLNGVERFFIEKIRVNHTYHIAGMDVTQAEIISTLLFFLGIFGIWYFKKKHKQEIPVTVSPPSENNPPQS